MPPIPRRSIHLPAPGTRRAVVIGAGSFGTAVAVLLARGGLRTTLQTRTEEQAERLREDRENREYLDGVELPRELRIEHVDAGGARAEYVFLSGPATGMRGLNVAGAAAGHIFAEVWRWAEAQGARPESMIGLAGTGDLVATALAPESRNRRAGELLAHGVPASEIGARVGQAVEALKTVPLLAPALRSAGFEAPVTGALARLISGDLPLDEWI